MSEFLDPLDVRQTGWNDGRPTWITLAPMRYASEALGGIVTVPAEFVTDLASTPRFLLTWMIAGGRAPRPAVVHDLLYQHPAWEDRGLADTILREAMEADPMSGTGSFSEFSIYLGVRIGGWWAWRNNKARATTLNPVWSAANWPHLDTK